MDEIISNHGINGQSILHIIVCCCFLSTSSSLQRLDAIIVMVILLLSSSSSSVVESLFVVELCDISCCLSLLSSTTSSSFSVITYQFDQMRLLIYYKSNDATTDTKNAVLKTFDLLSVKYRATGKAGLANKGGIVAEVKIYKRRIHYLCTKVVMNEFVLLLVARIVRLEFGLSRHRIRVRRRTHNMGSV